MTSEMTEKKKNAGGTGHLVKIVVVLTAICVGVALLLAFVNNITKDVIAENAAKQQSEAILALFDDMDCEKKTAVYDLDGTPVYAVMRDDGALLGYAVQSSGTGFGGEIKTMVGFNLIGEVIGVKIISMSETPGVGSKTKSDSFLDRFIGKNKEMTVGEDIDGITGATISSKGVTEAVNNAILATENLDVPIMSNEIGATLAVSYVKTGGND